MVAEAHNGIDPLASDVLKHGVQRRRIAMHV
jgi:hypothetical protein